MKAMKEHSGAVIAAALSLAVCVGLGMGSAQAQIAPGGGPIDIGADDLSARGTHYRLPAPPQSVKGLRVAEYPPNLIKKTVVGAGHADKNQILVMLKILLPKAEPKSPDAADALAIAITHAHQRQSTALRLRMAEV